MKNLQMKCASHAKYRPEFYFAIYIFHSPPHDYVLVLSSPDFASLPVSGVRCH